MMNKKKQMGNFKFILSVALFGLCGCCVFPPEVTNNGAEPWVGKIHRKEGQGEQLLYFKGNKMSAFLHTGANAITPGPESFGVATFNRTCVNSMSPTKFLVRQEQEGKRPQYLCMEIVLRSKGVFQVMESQVTNHIEPLLCYTAVLTLDPWLYVSFNVLKSHHQICPFAGGFNMKIRSPDGSVFGCNSMELPMRLESECIGGDGVEFQFRYETCKEHLPMEVDQRSYCVANWIDGRYLYSVLRKVGHDDLWCLRIPLRRGHNFTATLFLDAMCSSEEKLNSSLNFVSLNLAQIELRGLCQDEYVGCSEKRCTAYTEQSCQKSCGLCHARGHMGVCKFPKPYRGDWLQKSFNHEQNVRISSNKMTIQNVGTFKCVQGEPANERVERKYALVSMFNNGCRPRFTCVGFRRLGHSVLSYTLGKSLIWPFTPRANIPEAVCQDSSFSMDPNPIRDSYRGNLNTFKTIVSTAKYKTPVTCRIRQGFKLQGYSNRRASCQGSLYEDCNDPTRLRMELSGCGSGPPVMDFQCLSIYEGRYWENITILQNVDNSTDARCMVLSDVRAGEMLMLSASECDRQSWLWAAGGERTALNKFLYELEQYPCKEVPTKPPTTTPDVDKITYRLVSSSEAVLKVTNSGGDHRSASKTVTRVASSPTESLSKDSSLQSDSGNVGVVQAPKREYTQTNGARIPLNHLLQVVITFISTVPFVYLIQR